MMKQALKWLLLVLLLGYVAVMTVWARKEAATHVCRGIDVMLTSTHPADSTTRAGILAELKKYPNKITGAQLSTINTLNVEKFLSSLNAFEQVDCAMGADSRLKVIVTPMIPEIRVFDTNGKSFYVNKDGKRIASNAEFFVDVPVVIGHFTKKYPAKNVIPLVKFIQEDPDLSSLISGIKFVDANNIMLLPRISGHVINFGDTSSMDSKRRAILTAYRDILPRKGWNEYDTISVKFKGQIVATRRNKVVIDHGAILDEEIDLEEATLPEQQPTPTSTTEQENNTSIE